MADVDILIDPYALPGGIGTSATVRFTATDLAGKAIDVYRVDDDSGVVGTRSIAMGDEEVTIALTPNAELRPPSAWKVEVLHRGRRLSRALVILEASVDPLPLVDMLALPSLDPDYVITGLTQDEINAIHGAAAPDATNVFATLADVGGGGGGAGTVTSVAVSGSDGIEVDSGSPITGSGTIALGVNAATMKTHLGLAALAYRATIQGSPSGETDPDLFASTDDAGAIEMVTASGARTRLGLGTAATTASTAYATAAQGALADTALQPGEGGSFWLTPVGAVGDGVTDDAAAFEAALATIGSAGGGVLYVPKGTYLIAKTLMVPSNTSVMGAGRGATILRGAASWTPAAKNGRNWFALLAMIGVSNSTVRDLTADQQTLGATNGASGVSIEWDGTTRSQDCTIENVKSLVGAAGTVGLWSHASDGTRILNNIVDGGVTTDTYLFHELIEIFGGNNVSVIGNTVRNSGNHGIYYNPSATEGGDSASILISDNYLYRNRIAIQLTPGTTAKGMYVKGNRIVDTWRDAILVTRSAGVVMEDFQIVQNVIRNALHGITITSASPSSESSKVRIDGNQLDNITATDYAMIHVNYIRDMQITGNMMRTGAYQGIRCYTCDEVQINNNLVRNVQANAIDVSSCLNVGINGNMLYDWNLANNVSYGILPVGATNVQIDGNQFYATNATYPMRANSGDKISIGSSNKLLSTFNLSRPYYNNGTNRNRDTITVTAAAATKVISNTQVNYNTPVLIWQTGGAAILPFKMTSGTGTFTLTFASPAVGDETWEYIVL